MANNPDFKSLIEQTRIAAGRCPRRFKSEHKVRLGFLQKMFDKELAQQVAKAKLLFSEGQIVWGAIVQANALMFEPGRGNLPGAMLFSTDLRMDDRPSLLTDCAAGLFSYKGKKNLGDPALQAFADRLQNELSRPLGMEVPSRLTGNIACQMSVIQFERKHLPGGTITSRFMPILTHRDTPSIMVLPCKYWPKVLGGAN